MWDHASKLLALAAGTSLLFVGCGNTEEPTQVESSPGPSAATPTAISCPSGTSGGTDGGEYPEDAEIVGFETPEEAVEEWSHRVYPEADGFEVVPGGAWILRADGTAVARVYFAEEAVVGFKVDAYSGCAP